MDTILKKGFFYASLVIVMFFDNGDVDKKDLDDDNYIYVIEYSMFDDMEDLIRSVVIECNNNSDKIFKTLIMDNINNGLKALSKGNILCYHTKERGYKFGLIPK